MQDNIIEINLSSSNKADDIADIVANRLEENKSAGNSVKLKLGNVAVNQSQMIFIKSLVESYGNKLTFVETINDIVRGVCEEIGINATNDNFKDFSVQTSTNEETPAAKNPAETTAQKQIMGIYRKADEDKTQGQTEEIPEEFYAIKTDDPVEINKSDTIYVTQTLRNGQTLDFDGNIVIIGDCHPGSEIKATGDITVWGVLGSVAHAGAKGNKEAKIRALKMNAVQLRIADCYSRRPDTNNIPFVARSSEYTPEEARIVEDEIVLYNLAQN